MKKTQIKLINNQLNLFFGKKRVSGTFDEITKVTCINLKFFDSNLATICTSDELYQKFHGKKMALINLANGKYINVIIQGRSDLAHDVIWVTNHISEQLDVKMNVELLLCRYKASVYTSFYTQKIDHIRENNIVVSQLDLHDYGMNIPHSKCDLFEIFNSVTKESMVVKRSHIFIDPTLPKGTVKLNRKQRICLGLELPLYLTPIQRNTVELKCTNEEKKLIYSIYTAGDYFLKENATYEQCERAKKILLRNMGYEIHIMPVIEAYYCPEKRGPIQRFTDFYVGKSTVSLICRRPYENDEGINVVRMSKSNMRLLGIEEMDMVCLKYKKNRVRCRVLELDNEKSFFKTNLPVATELAIGIPSHIRKKLGITELNTTIKVDRDTGFIFKRSMNEQIVPILLTLFSTSILGTVSELIPILLSIILVPIVLYFNLSSKRNMRG